MVAATLPGKDRDASLDLLRGLAALAVCAGHARAFLLVDWGEIRGGGSVLDAAAYFATGLGHQAVMVFFVLSGYFVGGSVDAAWNRGRWSWSSYATNRLTRLLVVLVPALLITLLLDLAGESVSPGYSGAFHALLQSGPAPDGPARHDLVAFLGNVAFLQTIAVPVYGSNGPLWSLANEFWYYALFPLLWEAAMRRGAARWMFAAGALALVVALPAHIVAPGSIWLMGYAAWRLARVERLRPVLASGGWIAATGAALLLTLAASKRGSWVDWDYVIGFSCALFVMGLAEISYTLYLTHFPLFACLWFALLAPTQFMPGLQGYGLLALAIAVALAFAHSAWWLFERRTPDVRRWVAGRLPKRAAYPAESPQAEK